MTRASTNALQDLSRNRTSNNSPYSVTFSPQSVFSTARALDVKAGITEYYDKKSSKWIPFEDYWARKEFKSQPFYQLGKSFRSSVNAFCNWISDVISSNIEYLKQKWNLYTTPLSASLEPLQDSFFDHHIQSIFEKLSTVIEQAKEKSAKRKKPLLILIGEIHNKYYSIINEAIVFQLILKRLPVSRVLTEAFPSYSYEGQSHDYIQMQEKLLHHFNLKKVPIDFAKCSTAKHTYYRCEGIQHHYKQITPDTDEHPESMKIRDEVMSKVACQFPNSNIAAIVGNYHLKGMVENEGLSNTFEILPIYINDRSLNPIRSTFKSQQSCEKAFKGNPHASQFCFAELSEKINSLPYPQTNNENDNIDTLDQFLDRLQRRTSSFK